MTIGAAGSFSAISDAGSTGTNPSACSCAHTATVPTNRMMDASDTASSTNVFNISTSLSERSTEPVDSTRT